MTETDLERAASEYARAARVLARLDRGAGAAVRQTVEDVVRETKSALHAAASAAYAPQPALAADGRARDEAARLEHELDSVRADEAAALAEAYEARRERDELREAAAGWLHVRDDAGSAERNARRERLRRAIEGRDPGPDGGPSVSAYAPAAGLPSAAECEAMTCSCVSGVCAREEAEEAEDSEVIEAAVADEDERGAAGALLAEARRDRDEARERLRAAEEQVGDLRREHDEARAERDLYRDRARRAAVTERERDEAQALLDAIRDDGASERDDRLRAEAERDAARRNEERALGLESEAREDLAEAVRERNDARTERDAALDIVREREAPGPREAADASSADEPDTGGAPLPSSAAARLERGMRSLLDDARADIHAVDAARKSAVRERDEAREAADDAALRELRALRERDVLRRAVRGYAAALDAARSSGSYMAERERTLGAEAKLREALADVDAGKIGAVAANAEAREDGEDEDDGEYEVRYARLGCPGCGRRVEIELRDGEWLCADCRAEYDAGADADGVLAEADAEADDGYGGRFEATEAAVAAMPGGPSLLERGWAGIAAELRADLRRVNAGRAEAVRERNAAVHERDSARIERDNARREAYGEDGKGGLKGALALAEAEGERHARRADAAGADALRTRLRELIEAAGDYIASVRRWVNADESIEARNAAERKLGALLGAESAAERS